MAKKIMKAKNHPPFPASKRGKARALRKPASKFSLTRLGESDGARSICAEIHTAPSPEHQAQNRLEKDLVHRLTPRKNKKKTPGVSNLHRRNGHRCPGTLLTTMKRFVGRRAYMFSSSFPSLLSNLGEKKIALQLCQNWQVSKVLQLTVPFFDM